MEKISIIIASITIGITIAGIIFSAGVFYGRSVARSEIWEKKLNELDKLTTNLRIEQARDSRRSHDHIAQ